MNWKNNFIREFVNDHGNAWRPLRGLWVEDVIEFIEQVEKEARANERENIKKMIQTNKDSYMMPSTEKRFYKDLNNL